MWRRKRNFHFAFSFSKSFYHHNLTMFSIFFSYRTTKMNTRKSFWSMKCCFFLLFKMEKIRVLITNSGIMTLELSTSCIMYSETSPNRNSQTGALPMLGHVNFYKRNVLKSLVEILINLYTQHRHGVPLQIVKLRRIYAAQIKISVYFFFVCSVLVYASNLYFREREREWVRRGCNQKWLWYIYLYIYTHIAQCINTRIYIHWQTSTKKRRKLTLFLRFNAWGYQRIESNYLLYIYLRFIAIRCDALCTTRHKNCVRVFYTLKILFDSLSIRVVHSLSLSHPEHSIRFHAFSGFPIKCEVPLHRRRWYQCSKNSNGKSEIQRSVFFSS